MLTSFENQKLCAASACDHPHTFYARKNLGDPKGQGRAVILRSQLTQIPQKTRYDEPAETGVYIKKSGNLLLAADLNYNGSLVLSFTPLVNCVFTAKAP